MNATRIPTGGPEGADLESLLRAELGGVADAVADAGSPAPTQALLRRGHAARRRRTVVVTVGGALATALVLAVGFSVVPSQLRASQPSDRPDLPPASVESVKTWVAGLPVGDVPDGVTVANRKDGAVTWQGEQITLPKGVAGRSGFAIAYGETSRGLLVGWGSSGGTGGDDYDAELGWLSTTGSDWTAVETLAVQAAAVNADGTLYAYSGAVADTATQKVAQYVVVRKVADDAEVSRTAVAATDVVSGWLGGSVVVTGVERGGLSLLTDGVLTERSDLVRGPARVTAVAGEALQVVDEDGTCPSPDGTPQQRYTVVTVRGGNPVGRPRDLGCAPPDMVLVSPDGTHVVEPGSQYTIRSTQTGDAVGAENPASLETGTGTIAYWEPDGEHVQLVTYLESDPASSVPTVVRCSAVDGTCVRRG